MHELRRLFALTRPHRLRLTVATVLTLLGTGLNLLIPSQIGGILDAVFVKDNGSSLNSIALFAGSILLARLLLSVAAAYLLDWTSERVVSDLRRTLFNHLVRFDLAFFTHTRLGEITSRLTNDVAMIQGAITNTLTMVIDRSILAIGALVIMGLINWRLTLLTLITTPLIILLTRLVGRTVHALSRAAQDRLAAANSVVEESLGAIRVVKSFGREPYMIDKFGDEIEAQFGAVQERARVQAFYGPFIAALFMGGLILVIWQGAREVQAERLTAGQLAEFLLYAALIASSMSTFASVYTYTKRAIGASDRIFELLDQQPQLVSPPDPHPLPSMRGAITFEGVSFAYGPQVPILAELDFDIKAGELIALVGVSGVGKSTLLDLIPRFYDATAGRVCIDGVDVREADLDSLRAGIGSVPQDTVLFADTVKNNLRIGRLEATDGELIAAAHAANAHDFIMALPQGYDTLVGERGVRLSGGQRQRIAIARALLKEPAILLLDEATSSLDSESERAVQAALDKLLAARGRTTLVIAHRLSTIRNADRILVLAPVDGVGRLVEVGTHYDLLACGGVYHHLYQLQFAETAVAERV